MCIRRYLLLLLVFVISAGVRPAFAIDPGDDPEKKPDVQRSDSELDILLDLLRYLEGEHFPVYVNLINTSTASGGPYDITGVVRQITLPEGLQFVNTTADSYSSCYFEGNTGTCTSDSFPANGEATSVFYVSSTQTGPMTITGTKTQNEFDPDLNNNLASITVTIEEVPDGSISGVVYEDSNGNGVLDAGEIPLTDVDVNLSGASTATVDTDSGGGYIFTGLAEGDYTVTVQPNSLSQGPHNLAWHASAPQTGSYNVSLAAAEARSEVDFLIWQSSRAIITVIHDLNGNGTQDSNESSIANVELFRIDDCLAQVGETKSTSPSTGNAIFSDLAPGTYCFRVNPNQTFPGGTNGTALFVSGPPAENGVQQQVVTVTSGSDASKGFSIYTHGRINGNKFSDVDGDGMVESADTGLAGWTIELKDNEGTPVGTTVTAADGSYEFTEVLPGNYEVTEVLQASWEQTVPGATGSFKHAFELTSNELEAEKDFLNQFQDSDIAVEKTVSPDMVSEGDTLTFQIKVTNAGSTDAENVVMNDTFTDFFQILSTTTVSSTCTVQGLAVSCDVGTLAAGTQELIFVTARAVKAGTTNNVATVTTTSQDSNELNNIDTVEITIRAVSLTIELVSVQHQTCINGILDVDEETTDGNRVIIKVAVTNGAEEIAEAVTLHFKEAGLDRFLGDGTGVQTGIVPGNSTVEFEYTWNSTGWAWSDGEVAHLTARTIKVDGLRNGGLFGSVTKDVVVKPKPIILVHGLWSNAAAWGSYPGFANSQHANYAGRVSPATGMDTGVFPVEAMKNPTTMYEMFTKTTIGENAAALDAYIDQVRSETNSCHVDIVAHSMGGLITRHWIHNTMPPMEDDGERLLRHLVQLGTPNEGSPCADDIMAAYPKLVSGNSSTAAGFRFTNPPNNVIELTTTQVIYGFNPVVNNYKGVPIYLAFGNKFFFTCRAFDAGDGVVPVKSATAYVTSNPIFTGQQEFNAEHTSMPGSESMYIGWVQPILSEPPGGGPLGYEPGLEDDSENGSWAASKVDGQEYLMTLAESIVRDQELVIDIPVGDVTSFGVSYLTAPDTDSQLFDPSGVEVASVSGGSDEAQIGLRAHSVENPESGTWQLKLNQSELDEVGLLFSAWVIGSDVSLELQVDPASEPNHVLFKATFLQGTTPITGATASAMAVAEEGSSIFPLFDDGSNGDETAGDGVYSALFRPEQPGTFLFSVEAEGSGQFRTRTINQDITGISGVGVESTDESIPTTFAFGAIYPNPARTDARVPFQVAETADVDVRLYDMLGKERAVLATGMMQPGSYESSFSTADLPSGQYLVRARIGNRLFTRKVSVVR